MAIKVERIQGKYGLFYFDDFATPILQVKTKNNQFNKLKCFRLVKHPQYLSMFNQNLQSDDTHSNQQKITLEELPQNYLCQNESLNPNQINIKNYPITENMDISLYDENAQKQKLEAIIRQFTIQEQQYLDSNNAENRQKQKKKKNHGFQKKLIRFYILMERVKFANLSYSAKKHRFQSKVDRLMKETQKLKVKQHAIKDKISQISETKEAIKNKIKQLFSKSQKRMVQIQKINQQKEKLNMTYIDQCIQNKKAKAQLFQTGIDMVDNDLYSNPIPTIIYEQNLQTKNKQMLKIYELKSKIHEVKANFCPSSKKLQLENYLQKRIQIKTILESQNSNLKQMVKNITEQNPQINYIKTQKKLNLIQRMQLIARNNTSNQKLKIIRNIFKDLDDRVHEFSQALDNVISNNSYRTCRSRFYEVINSIPIKLKRLNKVKAKISMIKKKLDTIDVNSKNRLKDRRTTVKRKNQQLKDLLVQKQEKALELQMEIEQQKHRNAMKQIQKVILVDVRMDSQQDDVNADKFSGVQQISTSRSSHQEKQNVKKKRNNTNKKGKK